MESQDRNADYQYSLPIIAYKLLFGLVEFLLGVSLAFFHNRFLHWYRFYVASELSENPHDLLVRLTKQIVPAVLTHHAVLTLYLILLGGVKIAGAIGLVYKKNWGVDLLVSLTFIMLPFQVIELITHPSLIDFLYISLGLIIALYLINFRPKLWAEKVSNRIKSS